VTTATTTSVASVWQLADRTASSTVNPLDLWQSVPAGPANGTAFDPGAAPVGTVWRVRLPADAAAADVLLTHVETSLAQTHLALAASEDRLSAVVARHAGTPFVSPREATAGSQLEQLLAELPGHPAADGAAEFATGPLSGLWRQVVAEATAFLARLDRAIADHSRVETEQGGRLLAVTELTWGSTRTVWKSRCCADHHALHQRAVGLVFESRLAIVRTFVTVIRAATLLAALFTPGAALLAFPAALQFVTRFLAEARVE
jgi:hypothetical protein